MKRVLKKNQLIITALAIMIAVAGYLNYADTKTEKETTSEHVLEDTEDSQFADISDEDALEVGDDGEIKAVDGETADSETTNDETTDSKTTDEKTATDETATTKDSKKKTSDTTDEDSSEKTTDATDTSKTDSTTDSATTEDGTVDTGEAVMVNTGIDSDYFSAAKLSREQTRAKNKELLLELVSNKNTTDAQKENAIQSIVDMTAAAEKETAAENMLEAKGFADSVVSIVDGEVDVVVNATQLTNQQVAQIEDVVKRKTDISAEHIVITPVTTKK